MLRSLSIHRYLADALAYWRGEKEARLYIKSSIESERAILLSQLSLLIDQKQIHLSALSLEWDQMEEALFSLSFIQNYDYVILDYFDLLSEEKQKIALSSPYPLLIGISGKQIEGTSGALLDFTKEKPWERKKRWQMFLENEQKLSKKIASILIESFDPHFELLDQEVKKLKCYGSWREDLMALPLVFHSFEVARRWVWEGLLQEDELDFFSKPDQFFSFLGQLRYQIYLGFKILGDEKEAKELKLRAEWLEKIESRLASKGADFYQRALLFIALCEKNAKEAFFDGELSLARIGASLR